MTERFWAKVNKTETCWLWTASTTPKGYGKFSLGRDAQGAQRLINAHRFAYEQVVGPIAEGLELDHLCREKLCVNPDHLEPVTHAENMRRMFATITHCPQGHEYDEANLYTRPKGKSGGRMCRTCHRLRERRRRAAKGRAA